MAKTFAPRVKKKERKTIDLSDKLSRDLFKLSDERLLKDARLDEIVLSDILVKEQVRTKFNDNSLDELAQNIRLNGLIQPLVVHKESKQAKYTLVCGERRFRAMGLINKVSAPCFILEDKSPKELMAIQFSENSSREELHYIDKADGILNYQLATEASERQIMRALGSSKSEVHRSLLIARLPRALKEAAKQFNIEKYVLLELDALEEGELKASLMAKVQAGELTKRAELKRAINAKGALSPKPRKKQRTVMKRGTSASAFLKMMNSKKKDLGLDKETQEILQKLVEETKELMGP